MLEECKSSKKKIPGDAIYKTEALKIAEVIQAEKENQVEKFIYIFLNNSPLTFIRIFPIIIMIILGRYLFIINGQSFCQFSCLNTYLVQITPPGSKQSLQAERERPA
jgi:hypothetical protein